VQVPESILSLKGGNTLCSLIVRTAWHSRRLGNRSDELYLWEAKKTQDFGYKYFVPSVYYLLHTGRVWLLIAVLRGSLLCGWAVGLDYNKGSLLLLLLFIAVTVCERTQASCMSWVNKVLRPSRHITSHFWDESSQAIDSTGTGQQNKETEQHMHLKHK